MNLLQETIDYLKSYELNPDDILWIQNEDEYTLWSDFICYADFEYNNSYGGQEISPSLQIVGKNWWLERHEYDGSEWWEYKRIPVQPEKYNPKLNLKYW